jgi:antitoxin FitA
MFCTCDTLICMSKMIQIRNVPDQLHRTLKVRAAKASMTLSDYLLSEIEQIAEKPSLHEWLEKVSRDEPVEVEEPPEAIIRRMRDADDPYDLG